MSADKRRPSYADLVNAHAAEAWRTGQRWRCQCPSCETARRDWYEPKSTIDVMLGGLPRLLWKLGLGLLLFVASCRTAPDSALCAEVVCAPWEACRAVELQGQQRPICVCLPGASADHVCHFGEIAD